MDLGDKFLEKTEGKGHEDTYAEGVKIVKDVSDEMIGWKTEGTELYQELAGKYLKTFNECEPLRRPSAFKKKMKNDYQTLGKIKKKKKATSKKKK